MKRQAASLRGGWIRIAKRRPTAYGLHVLDWIADLCIAIACFGIALIPLAMHERVPWFLPPLAFLAGLAMLLLGWLSVTIEEEDK